MFKKKILRFLASINQRRVEKHMNLLSDDKKYVYNIAIKLLALSSSELESSPKTEIIYVRNGLKLLKIDLNSIFFVNDNGQISHSFSYETCLMRELRRVYYRHKEISIRHMVDEISEATTVRLKETYSNLIKKQS